MNHSTVTESKTKPGSIQAHGRQIIWQIWLPLILASLLVIGLAVLTVLGASHGSVAVTKWSHFSSILMIIPILFIGLIIFAIIGAAIYGLAKALKILPAYTGLVQAYTSLIAISITIRANQLLNPIFAIQGWIAAVNRFWSIVRGKNPA